ncbi:hypothetical protein ACFE04_025615 [Oxalis oulophora]
MRFRLYITSTASATAIATTTTRTAAAAAAATTTTTERQLEVRNGHPDSSSEYLKCLLDIARAFGMGSCLSAPSSADTIPLSASMLETIKSGDSTELLLHRIPGRLFLNGSTDVVSLFSKQGKKGVNQDAMIVWEDFSSEPGTIFCGVFDGHGPNGHFVAKKVRDSLPLKLKAQCEMIASGKDDFSCVANTGAGNMISEETPRTSLDRDHDKSDDMDVFPILKDAFLKAFKVMDKELQLHPYIDAINSGTTAVTLVKQGIHLVIGNLGDSRAVLGTRGKDGMLVAKQLTVDLKPSLPKEAKRIKSRKGRVFALRNEPQVTRMWLPKNNSPGLAMSRAFGDFCLKGFGLISVPDITHHLITEKDEFVVLASDGVWDVLSNEEVINIVASVPRSNAAQMLVNSAVHAWRIKYPHAKVDDCAAVCLFLGSTSDNFSTYNVLGEKAQMRRPIFLAYPEYIHLVSPQELVCDSRSGKTSTQTVRLFYGGSLTWSMWFGRERRAEKCQKNPPTVEQSQVGNANPPKYMVVVENKCPMCPVMNIHLKCGGFLQSLVTQRLVKVVSYDDCVVNSGLPLRPFQNFSFTYTHSKYLLHPSNWSFQCE